MARPAAPPNLGGMARPGDVLVHPDSSRKLIFRRTTSQTTGRLVEFDVFYGTREPRPDAHAHDLQEHQIELLEGSMKACVAGRVQVLCPGEVLLISPGDSHAVWNPSSSAAHAVWRTYPALETEASLEATWHCQPRGRNVVLSEAKDP
jgi:quercetin dioxygenase-like cupin family protein